MLNDDLNDLGPDWFGDAIMLFCLCALFFSAGLAPGWGVWA